MLPAPRRVAVRVLHARHGAHRAGPGRPPRPAEPGGDQVRPGRQPVPVHRLHQDPRCRRGVRGPGGGRAGGGPVTTEQVTERPAGRYRVVGRSPAHHDFVDKVKGSLLYAADWRLPGMLHGRIVRSPLPSVAAVLTAADVPGNRIVETASGGLAELEVAMPVLAEDRVRYLGEPVAIVAAVSPQVAHEAAELVAVDY